MSVVNGALGGFIPKQHCIAENTVKIITVFPIENTRICVNNLVFIDIFSRFVSQKAVNCENEQFMCSKRSIKIKY